MPSDHVKVLRRIKGTHVLSRAERAALDAAIAIMSEPEGAREQRRALAQQPAPIQEERRG